MDSNEAIFTLPLDVQAVQYLRNYFARFPNADYQMVAAYIESVMPWATKVESVQMEIISLITKNETS